MFGTHRIVAALSLVALSWGSLAVAQEEKTLAPPSSAESVEALVAELAAEEFKTRQAARQKLLALAESAVPGLTQAVRESDDPEIRTTAQELLEKIAGVARPGHSDHAEGDRQADRGGRGALE